MLNLTVEAIMRSNAATYSDEAALWGTVAALDDRRRALYELYQVVAARSIPII